MKQFNLILLLTFFIFTPEVLSQSSVRSKAEVYQNQQRALRLSLLKNEIKALDDAPMRCYARLEIAEFIFDNDVRGEFDSANSMAINCLEDTVDNSDQFSEANAARWQNYAISLLRQKSPEVAIKAEKKYLADADSALSDLQELNKSGNTVDIANRTILKIQSGKVSDYVLTIYQYIREKDSKSAFRILEALLGYFETTENIESFAILLDFIGNGYLEASAPVGLTRRYLLFVVSLGRRQIGDAETGQTARFVFSQLKKAIARITEVLPALDPEAQSIFLILKARFDKNNREMDDIYNRIEDAKDKLQQTIAEAEATNNIVVKDELWRKASKLALEQKKFRLAVDCILKVAPNVNSFISGRDYFLLTEIIPASLKEDDFDGAEYATKRIGDEPRRSSGMLKTAHKYIDLNNKAQAFESLEDALKLLQKGQVDTNKMRVMFSAVQIALKLDKSKAFEVASLAIRMANRLPTPNVDDKIGTASRVKYVDEVTLPNAYNFLPAFEILARSDAGFATATAQEIESKNWRLVAEIAIEKEQKYPLPTIVTSPVSAIQPFFFGLT